MAQHRLLPKHVWKHAVGAKSKPRRLHLEPSDGLYHCPVENCDSYSYRSQRGCRKHVSTRHGWYYFFDEKPKTEEVLPAQTLQKSGIQKTKRSQTSDMPSFSKTCILYKSFFNWLVSPGGSLKSRLQADQICCRTLKFLKYCCQDACSSWDVPLNVVDYCLGSIQLVSDYVEQLEKKWKVGYSGIIGHVNALSHLHDFRRMSDVRLANSHSFIPTEIYMERVRKSLSKKMRSEWHTLLSVEYLSSIDCWASLKDLQNVIPWHGDRFAQVIVSCSVETAILSPHDLSFCTSFIVTVLFIMVKASRPMTYQFLTVDMINRIDSNGMIDQTMFKTKDKYGFDSLIFSSDVLDMVVGYIKCARPRLNPRCDYLLVSRNGTQVNRLGDIFGRLVFQAIGKYIHPTRYRQIVETESADRLTVEEQSHISEDQKHTSNVAKVFYKKLHSRSIAEKGKAAMDKLCDNTASVSKLQEIRALKEQKIDFQVQDTHGETKRKQKIPFSKYEDNFIRDGLKKYGKGKWTSILNDPDYSFISTRTTASLLTRAKSCKFI